MLARLGEKRDLALLVGYAFAFCAATAYGAGQVLIRENVTDDVPPMVGSLVAIVAGTIGFLPITVRYAVREKRENIRRGAMLFATAGIFASLGVSLMFLGLERAEVVVISPVLSTSPIFTLVFAALFLRGVERINLQVVLGALLVVAGVVVLSLS